MKNIVTLFILILFSGCTEQKTAVEKWDNQQPKIIHVHRFNRIYQMEYYADGQLAAEGVVSENQRIGEWTTYHPNGQIQSQQFYVSGKLFDKLEEYHENGKLKAKGEYNEEGKKHGSWTYYDEKGKIEEQGSYIYGRKVGNWNYYNDKKAVKKEQYDGMGRLEEEKEGDFEEYIFKDYHPNGQIKALGTLKKNVKEGEWITYYENGTVRDKGNYKKGVKIGHWVYFYDDDRKKGEGNYLENASNSPIYKWTKSYFSVQYCVLDEKAQNRRVGEWMFWNKDGKLVEHYEYELNREGVYVPKVVTYQSKCSPFSVKNGNGKLKIEKTDSTIVLYFKNGMIIKRKAKKD